MTVACKTEPCPGNIYLQCTCLMLRKSYIIRTKVVLINVGQLLIRSKFLGVCEVKICDDVDGLKNETIQCIKL